MTGSLGLSALGGSDDTRFLVFFNCIPRWFMGIDWDTKAHGP
jgi:hypothetical protein